MYKMYTLFTKMLKTTQLLFSVFLTSLISLFLDLSNEKQDLKALVSVSPQLELLNCQRLGLRLQGLSLD